MYVFGSEGIGLIPPGPRGGRPGGEPDVPVSIRLPATETDPFNGEANAVLNAFKTEWQKILAAHITAVGERVRRMQKLLGFVLAEGARRFPSGSLLKPAYDMLLSQMRSRIAAQVIADNRARGIVEPTEPKIYPKPPALPPPEPKIYPKPPALPPVDDPTGRLAWERLQELARTRGAMTFAQFKTSRLYDPGIRMSAERQYSGYVYAYRAPPGELVWWKPPAPDEPPIVVKPPPTVPGEVPVVYEPVEPAEVVTAGFDFGALLRPPLIFVLGGVAVLMLLKK